MFVFNLFSLILLGTVASGGITWMRKFGLLEFLALINMKKMVQKSVALSITLMRKVGNVCPRFSK